MQWGRKDIPGRGSRMLKTLPSRGWKKSGLFRNRKEACVAGDSKAARVAARGWREVGGAVYAGPQSQDKDRGGGLSPVCF